MPPPVSVTLALGSSAPYQKALASHLLAAGMLRRVLVPGLFLEVQDPAEDGSLRVVKRFPANKLLNRVIWGTWARLPGKIRPKPPMLVTSVLTDRLLSKWIEPCSIFHACTGFCLESLRAARRRGAVTLVDIGTRHPRAWRQSAIEECSRFGIRDREGAAMLTETLLRRMDREFETCDRIVVPSSVSRRSFAERGLGDKTTVLLTGVDSEFFSPPAAPRTEPPRFRVCYVGRVQMAKGVAYLLQAWKRLALPHAELVLIGEVQPAAEAVLRTFADSSVRFAGILPPQEVAKCYRESDLFAFPSVSEGLAEVVLEAMATGLPVVATDTSGANDCLEHGKEGLIVPVRDVDAMADAILWCYQHRDEGRAMGRAARSRIESQFTLAHYIERQIGLYRSLAGTPKEVAAGGTLQPGDGPAIN
jgi:glycosyltransferase involved in cell wall biosynthesis